MGRLRLLVLACGCATVIAGTVSAHAATITSTGGATDVAMGDSYSSGEGNPPFAAGTAGGCIDPSLSLFTDVRDASKHIVALGSKLVATCQSIELAAPYARVYVLGYPDLFSDSTAEDSSLNCLARTGMTAGSIKWLYRRQLQLDAVIKTAAQTAGVHYIDPNTAGAAYSFTGHDICSSDAWFHPLWRDLLPLSDLVYSFHPTVAGQQALAAALVAAGATNAGTISADSRSTAKAG